MNLSTQQLIQDEQYHFPYHWLPQLRKTGSIGLGRNLTWGLEYLTYMHAVAQMIQKTGVTNLLDVGCGDGRLSDFLKETPVRYTGLDYSSNAIALAQILNPLAHFYCGENQSKQLFDAVSLVEVLEHISDVELQSFLKSIPLKLKVGAKVFISVPTIGRALNRKHYRHYSYSLLEQQLQAAGLKILTARYVYRLGWAAQFFQRVLTNRYWTLNPSIFTKLIWKAHQRISYSATANSGAHLIVTAVPF